MWVCHKTIIIIIIGYSLFTQFRYPVVTMATEALPKYETLELSRPKEYIVQVNLNRPNKRNAMNNSFWRQVGLIITPDNIDIILKL